jgi:hypothetical protein
MRPSPSDEESQAAKPSVGERTGAGVAADAFVDGIPRTVYDRLVKAAKDELLYESNGDKIFNLATLQRLLLFHLQLKIVKETGPLVNLNYSNGNPLDSLKISMSDYGNFSHEYNYLNKVG